MTALKNVLAIVCENEIYGEQNDDDDCWIFYGDNTYTRTCWHDSRAKPWKIVDGLMYYGRTREGVEYWDHFFGDEEPEDIERNRKIVSIVLGNIFEREIMEVKMKKYIQLITSDAEGLTVGQLKDALDNVSDSTLVTFGEGFIAHKIAKTYITEPNGDTRVFLEIYDEKP